MIHSGKSQFMERNDDLHVEFSQQKHEIRSMVDGPNKSIDSTETMFCRFLLNFRFSTAINLVKKYLFFRNLWLI